MELTFIQLSSVREVVLSDAFELAIDEVTFVVAVLELKLPVACLCAMDELSAVSDLVKVPALDAYTMLLVVPPLAIVHVAVLI